MNLRKVLSAFKFLKHIFYHIHGIDISIHKTLVANFSDHSAKMIPPVALK